MQMKKRLLHLLYCFLAGSTAALPTQAQTGPEDITSQYLQSADFSSEDGWVQNLGEYETTIGGYGFDTELRVAEAFAGNPNLDVTAYSLTQEASLPAGDYRMTGYAFFRQGVAYDIDPAKSLAQMFAGENAVAVPALGSIEGAYANSMTAASNEFYDNNHYLNTLDFSLDTETTLTLGYKGTFDLAQSWFICGEVRLYRMTAADYRPEYQEAYAGLQALTGLTGGLQSVADQTLERYAQINEAVADYRTAIADLKATQAMVEEGMERVTATRGIIAEGEELLEQPTSASDAEKKQFDLTIATAKINLDEATTLEGIEEIAATLEKSLMQYAYNAGGSADITDLYIKDADYSTQKGWPERTNVTGWHPEYGFVDSWYGWGGFSLYQRITLPAGGYRLTCNAFVQPISSNYEYPTASAIAQMVAGNDTTVIQMLDPSDFISNISHGIWDETEVSTVLYDGNKHQHTLYFNLPEETTIPIGFRGTFSNVDYYTAMGEVKLYTMTLEEYQEQYQKAYSLLQQYTGCPANLQALIDQTLADYANVEETTASYNKAITSLNKARRDVDTCVMLISEAKALIAQCEALLEQTVSAPEEERTRFSQAIADAKASLETATAPETISQLATDLEEAYTLYASATGAANEVTQLYIRNADLSDTEGWTYNLAGRGFQPSLKVAETWYDLTPASYSLTQEVTLPAGGYRLTGHAFFTHEEAEGELARIIAGNTTQTIIEADGSKFPNSSTALEEAAKAFYTNNEYLNTLYFFLPQKTTLKLGYEGSFGKSNASIWVAMGAVRLYTMSMEEYKEQFQTVYKQLQEYAALTSGLNTLVNPTLEKYTGFEGTTTAEYTQALAEMNEVRISVENFPDSIAEAQKWITQSEELLNSTPAESSVKDEFDLTIAKAKINLEAATTLKAISQIIADLQQAGIDFEMAAGIPADVTDIYIQNADLANKGGWNNSMTSFDIELRVAEAYASSVSYEYRSYFLNQKITLPAGDYRLTGYAFFRQGMQNYGDPTKSLAQLYAGEEEQTVAPLGSIDCPAYAYYMEDAANEFYNNGNYLNTIDFSVGKDTTLTIGFKGEFDETSSWFICGEVKLYRMSLGVYQKEYQALCDELKSLSELTTGLGNIIQAALSEYSGMEESVPAYRKAIADLNETKEQANRFITQVTEANELVTECESNSTHSTPDNDEAKAAFDQAVITAKEQIDQASTLEEITSIMEELDNARQTYVQAAIPEEGYPFDYTFLIASINKAGTNWTTLHGTFSSTIQSGKELTATNCDKISIQLSWTGDMCYYTASDLPAGHYKVTADMKHAGILFANEKNVSVDSTGIFCLDEVIVVPNDSLLIGFANSTSASFIHIKLEYKGVLTEEEHLRYEQERLQAEIDEATAWSQANVGEDAFQIPESAAAALKATIQAVTPSVESTSLIAIQAARETLADALDTFRNSELNAPEEGELFNIISSGDGTYSNRFVTMTGNSSYYYNNLLEPSDHLAQTFMPEAQDTPNHYKFSALIDGNEAYLDNHYNYTPTENTSYLITPTETSGEYDLLYFRNGTPEAYFNPGYGFNTNPIHYQIAPARKATIGLNVTEAGWATLMLPFDAEVPEGLTAYVCGGTEDSQKDGTTVVTLEQAETLEAHTPYILSGAQGNYSFSGYGTAGHDMYGTDYMTGTYVDMTAWAGTYVLQNQDGKVGFYKVVAGDEPTVGANRAYMNQILEQAGINVLALRLPDEGGISTGIGSAETDGDTLVNVYDLNGRLVRQQVKTGEALQGLHKGIYIVNGVKKAVK